MKRFEIFLLNPEKNASVGEYTIRDFFIDVLKENYANTGDSLPERSDFELWRKPRSRSVDLCIESLTVLPHHRRIRCAETGCSFKGQPCQNKNCTRIVCDRHHPFICLNCCKDDFYNTAILKKDSLREKSLGKCVCKAEDENGTRICSSKTRTRCANQSCGKIICTKHRVRLCYPCVFEGSRES